VLGQYVLHDSFAVRYSQATVLSRYDGVREFEINCLLECDKKEFENFCQKLSRGEFVDHQLSAVAEILMALKRIAPVSSLGSSPEPAPAPPAGKVSIFSLNLGR